MKVGILGDGQLARMMVGAGAPLGIDVIVLGNSGDRSVIGELDEKKYHHGNINDYNDVYNFCSKVDSLVVEIEHFNLDAVKDAQERWKFKVTPHIETLRIAQDKYIQKEWFEKHMIPCVKMYSEDEINGLTSLAMTGPLVVKPRSRGFDGRGIEFIEVYQDLIAWKERNAGRLGDYVFEEMLDSISEIAIAVIREDATGMIQTYPCVESIQKKGMCRVVIAPAPFPKEVLDNVESLAKKVAAHINLNGLLCIELFYCKRGLFVNEIAPRPHNTAHYTINACVTSQFEQVMRLAADLEPGVMEMVCKKALMINLIGLSADCTLDEFEDNARRVVMRIPKASLHLYKKSPRPSRKLGHFTLLGDDLYKMVSLIEARLGDVTAFESPASYLAELKSRKSCEQYDVAILMGSKSDLPTMRPAVELLKTLGVSTFATVVSAHRTPERMYSFAKVVEREGFKIIIAGAGGAAHLPGMLASLTSVPVIGVPVSQKNLGGADSLYSIVQMPAGIPVATVAIDNSTNAALLAAEILSLNDPTLSNELRKYKCSLRTKVLNDANSLEKEYGTLNNFVYS